MNDEIYDLKKLKLLMIAIGAGLVVGSIGVIFEMLIDLADDLWKHHTFIIYLLPIFGMLIIFITKKLKENNIDGPNQLIYALNNNHNIKPIQGILIFIATTLSHLGGASVGKEGAALVLGSSVSNFFTKLIKLNAREQETLIFCGMSACFSGLFGTPLTAAIFCLEILVVGNIYLKNLLPTLISALIAAKIRTLIIGSPITFNLDPNIDKFSIIILLALIFLAIIITIFSNVFIKTLHLTKKIFEHHFPNPYLRIIIGALIFILITAILKDKIYYSGGINIIQASFKGSSNAYSFLLKIILTSIVLGAGFKGGEIVPTLAIGAGIGMTFSGIFNLPSSLFIACAMIAYFVALTKCPIASLALAIELFNIHYLHYFMKIIVITFIISGRHSLYSHQLNKFHQ
ncbi:MAG: chloride channel protein [Erysipelotrichaceae bacterium]|nr:chloride channel protein [Erysipelotrichaceae bacterium]